MLKLREHLILCLSYLLLVTDGVRCKPEYLYSQDAGGWLKLHSIPATWEDAFLRCHYEGAVLASPLNERLADALLSQMNQHEDDRQFFLGTRDIFSKGDFVSVEGVKFSQMEIKRIELRATQGDCLLMYRSATYEIDRTSCKDPRPYICYRKLDNQTLNECGTFDDEYHLDQRTGSCYKVHLEQQTWPSAYRICAAEGGHLVILNDAEEARIVKEMFSERAGPMEKWDRFHIGLLAWGEDRTWITVHGERIEDVFHDWEPSKLYNHEEHQVYAVFLGSSKLAYSGPHDRVEFICEKSPDFIRFESFIPN